MADKEPNIVRAKVTAPTFINNVLHLPGEFAVANLDELGIKEIGQHREVKDNDGNVTRFNLTPGLEPAGDEPEPLAQVPVAAVAPHAPEAPAPQGIPTGTRQSGTGRLIAPTGPDETAHEPVGADKPLAEDNNDKPTKSGK